MASVQRQPFAELGASRLQGLTSQKNCQNAITDILTNASKPSFTKPQSTPSKAKRVFTPADDDSDIDTENQDPSFFASKGSKSSGETPSKKLKLNVMPSSLSVSTLNKPCTPTSPLFNKSTTTPNSFSFTTTSGANSAPAGRSPKHKRVGLLGKKRSSMSPFKRVNPPTFGSSAAGGLPFSIDAALNNTLSGSKGPTSKPHVPNAVDPMPLAKPIALAKVATIEESVPSGWFFDIHEDTPEEEASNLMEHSTGILDISSDDEASPRKKDERGKENIPPADHVDSNGNPVQGSGVEGLKSRRVDPDAMKDVGEERAPLGSLNEEEFFGTGLDKTSVEIVRPEAEHDESTHDENAGTAPASGLSKVEYRDDAHDCHTDHSATFSPHLDTIPEPLPVDSQTGSDPEAVPGFEIAIDQDCVEA